MRFRLQVLGGALALALAGCPAGCPAWAHHQGIAHEPPAEGIAIPNLLHGQMAVIAANRAAILDLAARQAPTDRVMRRLQGFISIQFSACAWGLVPGSLENEDSPFNECTHAYLAGTQALLLHLQGMPGDRMAVHALVGKIELDMLAHNAALVLCRYSDEPFNTAEIVYPRWGDAASTAGAMTVAGLMLAGCGAWWRMRWRCRCDDPAPPISA